MANTPSAFEQYVLGPINPGDITTVTIPVTTSAPGFGSANLTYQKVGNLYFNMVLTSVAGGFGSLPIGAYPSGTQITDTLTEIAALIGVTINTSYLKTSLYNNVAIPRGYYNSGAGHWQLDSTSNSGYTIIDGFLSN